MRIALISPGSFPVPIRYGGSSVETAISNIAPRLPADWTVTVLGKRFPGLKARETKNRVTYVRLKETAQKDYLHACIQYLQKVPHDMVQVENRPAFVPFLKKTLSCPVLLSLHSVTFLKPRALKGYTPQSCLNHADHIITNSRYLRSLLNARYGTSTPIHPVHLGVDTKRYHAHWNERERTARRLRSRFNVSRRIVVLFAGRLIPIKGVHLLLKAMHQAVKREPRLLCLVVGGSRYGSNRETRYVRNLKRIAKPIRRHVRFVGTIHPMKMPSYYALADLVVTPSIGPEALGLVNLEAMASGKPVISTAVGGIRETVDTGKSGILIKPSRLKRELAPSILKLSKNPSVRKRMGQKGRQIAEGRFSWERTARQYAERYERMLQDKIKGHEG